MTMWTRAWVCALAIACAGAHALGDEGDVAPPASTQASSEAAAATGSEGDKPAEPPKPELLSLSFKDMALEEIARFISEKTGKPVIPQESVKQKRITIVSTQQMELPEAMQTLREALRVHGVLMEEQDRLINLRPIEDAAKAQLQVLGVDEALDAQVDRSELVRKVFDVKHYEAEKIKEAITPMLPPYATVVADTAAKKLVVTDTVRGLERIEQVIQTLDVPAAAGVSRRIFELREVDATWVVSILSTMLAEQPTGLPLSQPGQSGSQQRGGRDPRSGRPGGGSGAPADAGVVAFASEHGPVLLVPDPRRNWVVAVAPEATMTQVASWIEQLDRPAASTEAFTLYDVKYAEVDQVAEQVQQVLLTMPGMGDAVKIAPFPDSRKLLVSGSPRGRRVVEDLLEKLDVETAGSRVMKVIQLEYGDAETVAENIKELFEDRYVAYESSYGSRQYQRDPNAVQLKVTADTRRNSLTIVTDAKTLEEIESLLREQWDLPVSNEDVQPRVYTLQHADPVQMKDLLESLFSEQQQSFNYFSYFYGDSGNDSDTTPVGRLFGQFSFQSLPDSNRLVVTTKTAANYEVIDKLIADLDQPQEAGLPKLIELAHANPEDLAEQINAVLAEPGTLAAISRSSRELSSEDQIGNIGEILNNNANEGGGQQRGQQQGTTDPNAMTFWWERAEEDATEQPSSNLIGKIRVVPVVRRNAVLIVAPPAYHEPIVQMITELDLPGAQVVIHAVIAEVEHDDQTTLGVRLASDPAALSDPALQDQAIGGAARVGVNDLFAAPFELGDEEIARGIFRSGINFNFLIQLLIREFGLKVLTEPKLYTADNEEADFFDGQDVSIQIGTQNSAEGAVTRSFDYVPVGTQLRIRPHITNEGNVSLNINVVLSNIAPGQTTFGNPVFDRRETSTQVVVQDGQTVMLGGITRQEEFKDVRKLPLLGDLPFVGQVFRSTDTALRNRELIIFITPRVVGRQGQDEDEVMAPYRETLDRLRQEITPATGPEEMPGDAEGSLPADAEERRKLLERE